MTICEAFQRTAARNPERLALTVGGGPEITWGDYRRRSERLAGGLAATGVGRGETIATLTTNRPEFFLLETATLLAGGTPLAMYTTSPPDELAHILDDSRPRLVFTEPQFEVGVRQGVASASVTPEVVIIGADGEGGFHAFEESCPEGFDVEQTWRTVGPDDIAVIIYTSGTTGSPKGVELSHHNLMAAWGMLVAVVPSMGELERVVSYLPVAHLADRIFGQYASIHTGATLTCIPDRRQIGAALVSVRPSTFLGVPRIWEKFRAALSGSTGPEPDEETARIARERVGLDQASVLWTGSAPLDVEVLDFFDSLDLSILEGYGMTETAATITTNRPAHRKHGTVGRAFPGVEIGLAADGEILVRGENVMTGYRNMPEQTAQAIDGDGWLHTGDVGTLDDEGFLTIVDRKKELLINSAGKNIAPTQIENALRSACHLLGPVAAIGDRRPYITALLTLDPDESAAWARQNGLADSGVIDLAGHPLVRAEIDAAVAEANKRLARVAQVKRFTVLADVWQPDSGLVTPTLKLKRKAITARYAEVIDAAYADA